MTPIALYHNPGSNCGLRLIWMMQYKGLEFVSSAVDLSQDQDYLKLNPFNKVPSVCIEGEYMSESMAIAEWLESLYPAPPLLPENLLQRAKVREVCEVVNASIHPAQSKAAAIALFPDYSVVQTFPYRSQVIADGLKKIQAKLFLQSNFCVGEAFSLADIFIAVIYQKARAMGLSDKALPAFELHWHFLLTQPEVTAAMPEEWHKLIS